MKETLLAILGGSIFVAFAIWVTANISVEAETKIERGKTFRQSCEENPIEYDSCGNFFLQDIRDMLAIHN